MGASLSVSSLLSIHVDFKLGRRVARWCLRSTLAGWGIPGEGLDALAQNLLAASTVRNSGKLIQGELALPASQRNKPMLLPLVIASELRYALGWCGWCWHQRPRY